MPFENMCNFNEHFLHHKRSYFFLTIVKGKPKENRSQKPFKNSDFLKSNFNEHFLRHKGLWFSFIIVKETLENKKITIK